MTKKYTEFLEDLEHNLPLPQQEQQLSDSNNNYVQAETEQYMMENLERLGYDHTRKRQPQTCEVFYNPSKTNPDFHRKISTYMEDLERYTEMVHNFTAIPDLLPVIQQTNNHDICSTTRPHPDGLPLEAIFQNSQQLSHCSNVGYLEPLLPPLRHPMICKSNEIKMKNLFNTEFLVHDFEAMCRKLKPHSKRVLIDLGASLKFHNSGSTPILYLLNLYEKFGFKFDHIYAFEITQTDPNTVYQQLLPEKYMSSYHWINTGVDAEEGHKLNPLHSIIQKFHEDDLIVLKVDIDSPHIELPLVMQLLDDKDNIYHSLIDQFYFEHHVHMGDLIAWWKEAVGTTKDSYELFQGLRKKGIGAHSWV